MNNSPNVNIRLAKEKDAYSIAKIHVASWQKIYRGHIPDIVLNKLSVNEREGKWRELINNKVIVLIIEKDNVIVGFVSLCPSRDSDKDQKTCGEISAIYLDPGVWHQGLGKKLCNRALSELKSMGFSEVILWVLKENDQARKFYESIGFTPTGDTKADQYDKNVILNEVRYQIFLKIAK